MAQLARATWRGEASLSYDELRRAESRYRLLAESSNDIIWLMDMPDRLVYASPACERLLGWSPLEQKDRPAGLQMLTPESGARAARALARAIAAKETSLTLEVEHICRDGSTLWCEIHQAILYDAAGNPVSTVGVTRDISEQRALREQLILAQKMDAIGTLAGGVAHDFNNFLTVIISSLELLGDDLADEESAELLRGALDAAERSSALTVQLLAFSRSQPPSVQPVDVNELVDQYAPMLRRLVGERIAIDLALEPSLRAVRADASQLQQVLLNLVVNARDAIDGDGAITIETGSVLVDGELARRHPGTVPGQSTMIAVRDDGCGMDERVQHRALDPFFSTKLEGQGTGLGLTMVRSIAEQLGGGVAIQSEAGAGTTVKVYLPCMGEQSHDEIASEAVDAAETLEGSESVLVVEDEEMVRGITARILERAGYKVSQAAEPTLALEVLEDHVPDLMLTDLVMPGMYGTELVQRVRERHPSVRFVLMSAYADTREVDAAELAALRLSKPFHARELLRAVRVALDGS